jgi:hypothetical protein
LSENVSRHAANFSGNPHCAMRFLFVRRDVPKFGRLLKRAHIGGSIRVDLFCCSKQLVGQAALVPEFAESFLPEPGPNVTQGKRMLPILHLKTRQTAAGV